MVYCSLKNDVYYISQDNVLEYVIKNKKGDTVFYGRSIKSPKTQENKINITEKVRDYLDSNLGIGWESGTTALLRQQLEAYDEFSILSGELLLEKYHFLFDYEEEFTGADDVLSVPINEKFDPRMKMFWTRFGENSANINVERGYKHFEFYYTGDNHFGISAETRTFYYTSTDNEMIQFGTDEYWFTITKGSGNTFSISVEENEEANLRTGYFYVEYLDENFNSIKRYYSIYQDYTLHYLTFKIVSSGTICWKEVSVAQQTISPKTIYYRKNGSSWEEITSSESGTTLQVNDGDKLELKGTYSSYLDLNSSRSTFDGSTAIFNVYGSIMSMIGGDDFRNLDVLEGQNNFYALFSHTKVLNARNLILPTTICRSCYDNMFTDCQKLITAPKLQSTILAERCYYRMFANCTSLVNAPELPATTLVNACYYAMFSHCASLVNAPELPATTLAGYCYSGMFMGCSSLTTAPELPVTTLVEGCYRDMFNGCTSLVTAPELPATTLAASCYQNMFGGCTSITKSPDLNATVLDTACYANMFYNCVNLEYIKCLSPYPGGSCEYWVYNVSPNGTFVIKSGTNWPTASFHNRYKGIPEGWAVQEEP